MEPTNEALVTEARQGSREALEELVRRVQTPVYGLALRMLFHPADAEDASQEILIKVITNLNGFRFEGPFLAWVMRIAANHLKAAGKYRAEKRALTMEKATEIMDLAAAKGWLTAPMEAPEPLLEQEMRAACTQALLLTLDRAHRLAFILGVVMEVSSSEGSYILDITPAAFRKRLSRARARVTDFLRANCGLFNQPNRCSCAGILAVHVRHGWIDPGNLLFASRHDPENGRTLGEYFQELDELSRIAALFRSAPKQGPSKLFATALKSILEQDQFRVLVDGAAGERPS